MLEEINLKNLSIGDEVIIKNVLAEGEIKKRLYDLGFIKGSKIKCILKSPLNSPTAYFIKGTTIALRDDVAKKIICEKGE